MFLLALLFSYSIISCSENDRTVIHNWKRSFTQYSVNSLLMMLNAFWVLDWSKDNCYLWANDIQPTWFKNFTHIRQFILSHVCVTVHNHFLSFVSSSEDPPSEKRLFHQFIHLKIKMWISHIFPSFPSGQTKLGIAESFQQEQKITGAITALKSNSPSLSELGIVLEVGLSLFDTLWFNAVFEFCQKWFNSISTWWTRHRSHLSSDLGVIRITRLSSQPEIHSHQVQSAFGNASQSRNCHPCWASNHIWFSSDLSKLIQAHKLMLILLKA